MEKIKQYSLEQFPKNKDITSLSVEQLTIRKSVKEYTYKDKKTCKTCNKELSITEFYVADKNTGRRHKKCRDCKMKSQGIVEIGKTRFALKIMEKGFRRCSICKETKHISAYRKSKTSYKGYGNNCYDCAHRLHVAFIKKQQAEIGFSYIKQYASRKGIFDLNDEKLTELREEIIKNRQERDRSKFFVDGLEFTTRIAFAEYIEKTYGIPVDTTEKRIVYGKTEEECKLSQSKMKSIAYTKGKVKVLDTITNKTFMFDNTQDERLLKMFGKSTISNAIKTGNKTRVTSLSLYKNPCIITRINKSNGKDK